MSDAEFLPEHGLDQLSDGTEAELYEPSVDSDELEEEVPSHSASASKRKRGRKNDDGEFRLDALSKPRGVVWELSSLASKVEDGIIDLEADYQRDVVWGIGQQIGLINSIAINAHIPPILLASYVKDNQEYYRCVDGKQRLTSIKHFMQGKIALETRKDRYKWYYEIDPNKRTKIKRELPENAKRVMRSKEIHVVIYSELSDDQERDLFQRIQNGKTLTAAEKLQALTGPYPDWARYLVKRYYERDDNGYGFCNRIITFTRGGDFQAFCEIIHTFLPLTNKEKLKNITPQTLHNTLLTRTAPPMEETRNEVENNLNRLQRLTMLQPANAMVAPKMKKSVLDSNEDGEVRKVHRVFQTGKPLAPIEFTWLPWAISNWAHLNDGDMLEAIEKLRTKIKGAHQGNISKNTTVVKSIHNFVQNFDTSKLTHIYDNDGSLRNPQAPSRKTPAKRVLQLPQSLFTTTAHRSADQILSSPLSKATSMSSFSDPENGSHRATASMSGPSSNTRRSAAQNSTQSNLVDAVTQVALNNKRPMDDMLIGEANASPEKKRRIRIPIRRSTHSHSTSTSNSTAALNHTGIEGLGGAAVADLGAGNVVPSNPDSIFSGGFDPWETEQKVRDWPQPDMGD
ncbi:hypothetical protein BT69DRAFT_1319369 [Atractiella rhizophila]|nr:hypothetical protein BT69DRAFT_1319369 [Atractiella rhizophila]